MGLTPNGLTDMTSPKEPRESHQAHVCAVSQAPVTLGFLPQSRKRTTLQLGDKAGGSRHTRPPSSLGSCQPELSPWCTSSSYILLTGKKKGLQKPFRPSGKQDTKSTYIEYATNTKATRRASGPYSETATFTLHRSPTRLCAFLDVPGSTGEDVLDGTRPSGTGEKMCDKSDLEKALMREEQWLTRLSSVG